MTRWYKPGEDPDTKLQLLTAEVLHLSRMIDVLLARIAYDPSADSGGHVPPAAAPPQSDEDGGVHVDAQETKL